MPPIHADEVDRAIGAERGEVPASLAEKGGERHVVHLARSHREGTMVDRTEAARMTIDRHVVGRIAEDHRAAFVTQQRLERLGIQGVAAQHVVGSETPQIPDLAEWRPRRKFGYGIGRVVSRVRLVFE
jgi:hypothetical protein